MTAYEVGRVVGMVLVLVLLCGGAGLLLFFGLRAMTGPRRGSLPRGLMRVILGSLLALAGLLAMIGVAVGPTHPHTAPEHLAVQGTPTPTPSPTAAPVPPLRLALPHALLGLPRNDARFRKARATFADALKDLTHADIGFYGRTADLVVWGGNHDEAPTDVLLAAAERELVAEHLITEPGTSVTAGRFGGDATCWKGKDGEFSVCVFVTRDTVLFLVDNGRRPFATSLRRARAVNAAAVVPAS